MYTEAKQTKATMKQQTPHVITHHEGQTIRLLIEADFDTPAFCEFTLDTRYDKIGIENKHCIGAA